MPNKNKSVHLPVGIDGVDAVGNVGVPVAVHIHVDGDGPSHVGRVGRFCKKCLKKFLFARGIGHGDAGTVGNLAQQLIAVPEVTRCV